MYIYAYIYIYLATPKSIFVYQYHTFAFLIGNYFFIFVNIITGELFTHTKSKTFLLQNVMFTCLFLNIYEMC